jgi:hypothetical protein
MLPILVAAFSQALAVTAGAIPPPEITTAARACAQLDLRQTSSGFPQGNPESCAYGPDEIATAKETFKDPGKPPYLVKRGDPEYSEEEEDDYYCTDEYTITETVSVTKSSAFIITSKTSILLIMIQDNCP